MCVCMCVCVCVCSVCVCVCVCVCVMVWYCVSQVQYWLKQLAAEVAERLAVDQREVSV